MSAVLLVFSCLWCYFLLSAFPFLCHDDLWLISYLLVTSCFTLKVWFLNCLVLLLFPAFVLFPPF